MEMRIATMTTTLMRMMKTMAATLLHDDSDDGGGMLPWPRAVAAQLSADRGTKARGSMVRRRLASGVLHE